MDSSKIKVILVAIVAMFAALYLGISAATAQLETVAWMVAGITLAICLLLGRRIWILLPFMAALDITFRVPGQPDSLLIAQVLFVVFSVFLLLMRKLPFHLAWTEVEMWIVIITLFLVQVYMRNPVGILVFGGDTVGGKPYVIFLISLVSAMLLSGLRVNPSELKWVPRLMIIGGLLNLANSLLGLVIPSMGYYTGAAYERADEPNYEDIGKAVDSGKASRMRFLSVFGNNAALWVSAYISPLRAMVRPLWGILVLCAVAAAMLSGFRNSVISIGLTLVLGIAYRSGGPGLVMSSIGAAAGLALLAIVNLLHPLHPNIQRSLTFLPGTWEQRYRDDAKASSEWRFEMWEEALTSEKWIHNKWVGDGLGFKTEDLEKSFTLKEFSGSGGLDLTREQMLINGGYHSGPISTIRTIGYIGLFFFLFATIRLAIHAHRQIQRCRYTEWFPLSLLICIPIIAFPLFYVFVFGDFKTGSSTFLLSCGMLRLLQNNLPLPAYLKTVRSPYVIKTR